MKIILGENFYIDVDENRNHTLKEDVVVDKVDGSKGEATKTYGYYGSIPSAVERYIELTVLRNQSPYTLKEYVEEYKRVKEEIFNMMED